MLQLINLSLSFGGQDLFRNLNWYLRKGDRVGLVGPNGAGKTTLFRLITGQVEPDTGAIQRGREVTIGYLPQEGIEVAGRSLFAEVRAALPQLAEIQRELTVIHDALEQNPLEGEEHDELIARYGDLQHRFEELGGFRADAEVAKVLTGLGFHDTQFDQPTATFSGGWQMRIALAKLLLQQPDVLLLDEPTNHLDLESLLWLENYLRAYAGSIVIISHDREFLDRIVNRIVALHRQTLLEYTGNYSAFERQFEEAIAAHQKAYEEQQEEIARVQRFIDTFRYNARKSSQVQSRVKQLDKLERLEPPQQVPKGVKFHFPAAPRGGRVVLELRDVSKRYDSLEVFSGLNLILERGDRVALVGVNGAGKSTLSRILAGVEPPTSGTRQLGHQVELDYYAQQQADRLQSDSTVYEEIARGARFEVVPELRTLLGAFLFSGDAVNKKVAVLSGGEKSRLALAKMLLQPSNVLLLDEPTNHLDMRTKDVLREALLQYRGTFVIVSHDRYFLKGLVTKVLEMRDGHLVVYPGTFEEFLEWKEREVQGPAGVQSPKSRVQSPETNGQGPKSKGAVAADPTPILSGVDATLAAIQDAKRGKQRYVQQKASRSEQQKREKRLAEIERQIAPLEARKTAIESMMGDGAVFSDPQQARTIAAEYETLKLKLDEQYRVWSTVAEEMEA
ncbi:MAG: ABC-F family ATP-binding cassette domain-containing protein [Deltaproteobacteria bacterium]|nr:ABC-F family ATP-binding cassette domain-containing protein [Deltaproteobacteria bacterium]